MSITTGDSPLARLRQAVAQGRTKEQNYLQSPFASVHLLLVAGAGLIVFGVMMSMSTTIAAADDGDPVWGQIIKQLIFLAVCVPVFWFAVRLPPPAYRKLGYPFLAMAVIALIAVLIPGIGSRINGARAWIDVGPVAVQPSEFGKLALLIWGADLLARKQQLGTLRRAKHLFIPLVPVFGAVCALVMLEPDLGGTITILLILLGVLWMIGMPMRYFAVVFVLVVGAVTVLAISAPYRMERLTTFVNPWADPEDAGYQTIEGLYALSSGGIFGVGLGQGTSKYGWLPESNTDFVFAIIGEELGLVGCSIVLVLLALLAYAGVRIARRSADPFARLVAGAATLWLCGQAVINIGYNIGLLPVTGLTLPFISTGGSSLLVGVFVIGMLVSFARHEPAAVTAGRRLAARRARPRLDRLLRLPVAQPYTPPRRRPTAVRTPGRQQ